MGSFTFTPDQFEELLTRLGNQNVKALEPLIARLGRPGSAAETLRTSVVSGPVGWSDLPVLDTSDPAGIDQWFVLFEVKLKAARIEPEKWAERFEECPRVPQEVKSRLPADAITDYALTRKWVLKEYGPLDPVGYFRDKI